MITLGLNETIETRKWFVNQLINNMNFQVPISYLKDPQRYLRKEVNGEITRNFLWYNKQRDIYGPSYGPCLTIALTSVYRNLIETSTKSYTGFDFDFFPEYRVIYAKRCLYRDDYFRCDISLSNIRYADDNEDWAKFEFYMDYEDSFP